MKIQENPGLLTEMTPCYWGSVNQWECDENNHLNVRFYAHKMNQAVQLLVSRMSDTRPADVLRAIRWQHIRFISESRAATPLRVDCGVIGHHEDHLEVLSLMHDNVTGRLLAAFVTGLAADGWNIDSARHGSVDVPDSANPRGIDPTALPEPPADLAQAQTAGYRIVGRGMILPEECDSSGWLLPHAYVGRISDGMPNLWALLNPPDDPVPANGALGGAALEQRLIIVNPLQLDSVCTQLSGVRGLGNKTQHMAHLLYDEDRDRVAAVVEAVGVAMDLTTRRAVPISEERRRHLQGLLLD